jgi:hypothetical protein
MSTLEDRLRDAYRTAADTVPAGSLADLRQQPADAASRAGASRRPRALADRRHLAIPLAAAATVLAVVVAAAVVVPHILSGRRPAPAAHAVTPYPPYLVAGSYGNTLQVISARTGAYAAVLSAPRPDQVFDGLASANGHAYVAALTTVQLACGTQGHAPRVARRARTRSLQTARPPMGVLLAHDQSQSPTPSASPSQIPSSTASPVPSLSAASSPAGSPQASPSPSATPSGTASGTPSATPSTSPCGQGRTGPKPDPCHFRLVGFRLGRDGTPTALTPLGGELSGILEPGFAVSGNGQDLAYSATACDANGSYGPTYVAVRNLATGQTRRWTMPGNEDIGTLSLSADGSALAFNIELTKLYPASGAVLATSARPGSLAARSHRLVAGRQFRRAADIAAAVLSPAGGTLYFTTNATGSALASHPVWQLRAYDVATGRITVVRSFAGGLPDCLAVAPSGRFLLVEWLTGSQWQTTHLARLNLATGELSPLGSGGQPLAW